MIFFVSGAKNMEVSQINSSIKPRKERNGLIDLYRFLLSLVVAKSHSLFAFNGPYFGPGRVCVEFFFVLSGYLFFSFLEKSKDMSLRESLIKLFKTRFLPICIPIAIAFVSNTVNCLLEGEFPNIWGYLWYVKSMLGLMIALVVLRKLIKTDRGFFLTVAAIMAVALALKFSGLLYSWGDIRAASSLPMGIFIAMLPKIKPKYSFVTVLMLVPVFALCLYIVGLELGNVEWLGIRIPELILDNLLYPALVYLTFCLNCKCKLFSYLGALSFGIYAFQCPADLMRTLGVNSSYVLFGFILLASVAEDAGKRIYRYCRRRKIEVQKIEQDIA